MRHVVAVAAVLAVVVAALTIRLQVSSAAEGDGDSKVALLSKAEVVGQCEAKQDEAKQDEDGDDEAKQDEDGDDEAKQDEDKQQEQDQNAGEDGDQEREQDGDRRTAGNVDCDAALLGPFKDDFVDIRRVRPNARNVREDRDASTGKFAVDCGVNQNRHNNPDNFIVAPGTRNGAQHVHDYVGNNSTDAFSTDDSLRNSGTTCVNNDKSTYFWPILRVRGKDGRDAKRDGGGKDGNVGRELLPKAVKLEFLGNPTDKVRAMPRFLRIITGDAKAVTNGPANAIAQWTCTGFEARRTTRYPLCPAGSDVVRILDFPSCWDGRNEDSANHRTHIVFPDRRGGCPRGTRAVPQLRMTLIYSVPRGAVYALDSFPSEKHNPLTDHADFANVMSGRQMSQVVSCINDGRNC